MDDYEKLRRGSPGNRRAFHLSSSRRSRYLSEWEISEDDIVEAERETSYIQYCRQKSLSAIRRGRRKRVQVFKPNDPNLSTEASEVPVALNRPDTDEDSTDQPRFNRRASPETVNWIG